jgi:hypothetical protein
MLVFRWNSMKFLVNNKILNYEYKTWIPYSDPRFRTLGFANKFHIALPTRPRFEQYEWLALPPAMAEIRSFPCRSCPLSRGHENTSEDSEISYDFRTQYYTVRRIAFPVDRRITSQFQVTHDCAKPGIVMCCCTVFCYRLNIWCKIWYFHGDDIEECRLLAYKNTVLTSQETRYVSATELSRLMSCKFWGFYDGDYEECSLLGCKTPVYTSQETRYSSDIEPSRLMLSKILDFHGGDNEEVVFSDVTPCGSCKSQHFGRRYRFCC